MKRGKILLLLVFGIMVASDGILLLNFLFRGDFQHSLSTSVRLALTVGLLACVYMGLTWARVIFLLLVGATLIYAVVAAVSSNALFMWFLSALLAFVAYVVGLSPSVKAFLAAQKSGGFSAQQSAPADGLRPPLS